MGRLEDRRMFCLGWDGIRKYNRGGLQPGISTFESTAAYVAVNRCNE